MSVLNTINAPPSSLPSVCAVTGCSVCDSDPGSKCGRCDEGRRLNGDNSACITGEDDGKDDDDSLLGKESVQLCIKFAEVVSPFKIHV